MTPFSYPKSLHVRTEQPPAYSAYGAYKPFLRREFRGQCVYCCLPDGLKPESFGADHYKPVKHFPELRASYPNLFYACNRCNSRKGSHWPKGANAENTTIPNPCDHVMFKHLRYDAEQLVEGKSTGGQFTIKLLDLNGSSLLTQRRTIQQCIELAHSRLTETKSAIRKLLKKLKAGDVDASDGTADCVRLQNDVQRLAATLASLTGRGIGDFA